MFILGNQVCERGPPTTYTCLTPYDNCCRFNGQWFCCRLSPNCCNRGLGYSAANDGDTPQPATGS